MVCASFKVFAGDIHCELSRAWERQRIQRALDFFRGDFFVRVHGFDLFNILQFVGFLFKKSGRRKFRFRLLFCSLNSRARVQKLASSIMFWGPSYSFPFLEI